MARYTGKRVSRRWRRVLTEAQKDGVRFTLNSGRRTMGEQWGLYRQNMVSRGVPKPDHPMTAFPSPLAPHIRVGRQDHALDVEPSDGGETRLQAWLQRHGVNAVNNVIDESWHMEARGGLAKLSRQIQKRNRAEQRAEKAKRKAKRQAHKARKRKREKLDKAREHGAHFAGIIWEACQKHDIPFALGLALVEQESGFMNQYGHDRDSHGNIVWHGKSGRVMVTEGNVRAYLRWRRQHGIAQGVGPVQLTSPGYQDEAQRRGGLHDPAVTIPYGLEILKGHMDALGKRSGIGAYNGGRGNPQLAYADSVLALERKWANRLD